MIPHVKREPVTLTLDGVEVEYCGTTAPAGQWNAVATKPVPFNVRVLAWGDNETGMVWRDVCDEKIHYAPQGGLVHWEVLHWMPIPKGPDE